jgi:plasmid stabilization system protein ParE
VDYEVIWSPPALEDVESLAEYISRDSEFYARAVVDKIVDTARKQKDFPFAGPIVPEFQDGSVRERFVYSIGSFTEWRVAGSRSWQSFTVNGFLMRWTTDSEARDRRNLASLLGDLVVSLSYTLAGLARQNYSGSLMSKDLTPAPIHLLRWI